MSSELLDSLIQGLIYERQTGNYFQVFLRKSGNKVITARRIQFAMCNKRQIAMFLTSSLYVYRHG